MTTEKYISSIIDALNKAANTLNAQSIVSSGEWTKHIKSNLTSIAQNFGYIVAASDVAEDADKNALKYGEWLYDLTWFKMQSSPEARHDWMTESIELVMESEWLGGTAIDEDFDKLVQARAALKLMIFQGDSVEAINDTNKRLSERVLAFNPKSPDDAYLLAAYDNSDQQFQYYNMDGQGEVKVIV